MKRYPNRRNFLGTVGASALAASLPRGVHAENESGGNDPFFFIQMADPQLFWGSQELWETAIGHANRLKPAFVVVCGDLLNRDGNQANLDPIKDRQRAEAYLEVAAKLDKQIPLYNVAGNHDVCNTPTPGTLQWYRARFGELWYTVTHHDCFFLTLQSDVLKNPQGAPDAARQQMKWLRETLQATRGKKFRHKIVFMHHPMCLKTVDEKAGYFTMPPEVRLELLGLFHQHGVRAVFSGHYHRNAHVKDRQLELVTTSSTGKPLGKDPTGFRIVKVYADRIEHKYFGYADMPEQVDC